MATEGFIQFIWKHSLYNGKALRTTCGQALEVFKPGEQNFHAGPDFFNAHIRLDHMFWAGNVEVHLRASDWYKHGHHLDPAYNNVILHVVEEYDTDVTNSLGRRIQTLAPDFHEKLLWRYKILKKSESWLPCDAYIKHIPIKKLKLMLGPLQAERALQKAYRMEHLLCNSSLSMDEVLYKALAPGYGIQANVLPFEMLSKGVPFQSLIDYRDNLSDLEAILFGHSGLLFPARTLGSYPSSLWNRYRELTAQSHEKPIPCHIWKFLRLRPSSFPTLRISQFASLIHHISPLAERILGTASLGEMEQLLRSGTSEYWTTHYLFGKSSPPFPKFPGEQFIATLLINVILPFLFSLEKTRKRNSTGIRAGEILLQLKAESNQIIRKWRSLGILADSAMESQALLQLYNVYCKQKRCLDCQIGAELIKAAIHEQE